jgi:ATP-binding cassette subfamily F protein 3
LLDEPTNHLDLPSIEWLEKYLISYKGSVVIVSHDKFFLNRMVNKIVEVYQKQINIYTGNYDYYEREKLIRIDMQQRAFENQQDYIRQQEKFIERFKAKASKAAQAQSVQKRLDKLDVIEDVQLERPDIRINFMVDKTPGKVLVSLKNLSKQFGDNVILENATAEIDRGDKIALIGANGKGKSTLLRIVAETETFEGERIWGHNVDESFYAQHQLEALNLNHTLLDEMREAGSQKTDMELRALLGGFLFSGDDIDKKIKVLSGGEKARIALAKTIVSKANFLMLDEPTNHLDMHSVELLAGALNKYQGSYILVSHDRYFISQTANKIWEIVDHKIKEFKGSYQEWVEWNERMAAKKEDVKSDVRSTMLDVRNTVAEVRSTVAEVRSTKSEIRNTKEENAKPEPQTTNNKQQTSNQPINRDLQRELQKQQRKLSNFEVDITKANNEKQRLELAMAQPENFSDRQKFVSLEADYVKAQLSITSLNKEYEILFEQVMELEAKTSG